MSTNTGWSSQLVYIDRSSVHSGHKLCGSGRRRHVVLQMPLVFQMMVLAIGFTLVRASKVLVFTMPGMRSHHMNMVKLAKELADRGHTVSMLVSCYDEIGQNVYATRGFAGLDEIRFAGAPEMGTEDWASKLSRDSAKVS